MSLENRGILLKETIEKVVHQTGGFLSKVLRPFMRVGLPSMKNVLTQLAKSVLVSLGLKVAASTTNAAIQKKIYRLGMTILIISNKEIRDILEIVKYLAESRLLNIGVGQTIENKAQK